MLGRWRGRWRKWRRRRGQMNPVRIGGKRSESVEKGFRNVEQDLEADGKAGREYGSAGGGNGILEDTGKGFQGGGRGFDEVKREEEAKRKEDWRAMLREVATAWRQQWTQGTKRHHYTLGMVITHRHLLLPRLLGSVNAPAVPGRLTGTPEHRPAQSGHMDRDRNPCNPRTMTAAPFDNQC